MLRSKNQHVYVYLHGYKTVFKNLLLVSTDRFGSDGSVFDSVVTENLNLSHGELNLLVRFSLDKAIFGGRTFCGFFL